ncbi:MAG: hypothetical protein QM754_10725 [Tepidisphaeraceae bacterium]
MQRSIELFTTGNASVWMGRPHAAVVRAIRELGIEPYASIEGVPHYATVDLHRVGQLLAGRPVRTFAEVTGIHPQRKAESV